MSEPRRNGHLHPVEREMSFPVGIQGATLPLCLIIAVGVVDIVWLQLGTTLT